MWEAEKSNGASSKTSYHTKNKMKSRYKMTLEAKREAKRNKGRLSSMDKVLERWDNNVQNIYSRSGLFTHSNCGCDYKKINQ